MSKKYAVKCTNLWLCGNEDCGQMSAWYVFSAMGFYPVNPSINIYHFGNMLFDSVRFKNDINSTVIYKNKVPDKSYSRNKCPLFYLFTSTDKIYFGRTISCVYNRSVYKPYFISAPVIEGEKIFRDKASINILSNTDDEPFDYGGSGYKERIFYTLDGSVPDTFSTEYLNEKKIVIDKNTNLTAISTDLFGFVRSHLSTAYFYKKPNNYTIQIKSTYNKQYTADGDEGLIDGLFGDLDWRKGRWQGYQNQDFEAVIDMKEVKQFSEISANFLQDTRSWIVMPTTVEFYISNDSINYTLLKTSNNTMAANDYNVQTQKFVFAYIDKNIQILPPNQRKEIMHSARYIKVVAKNYGLLPSWHQGAGGDAFIFIDEISIK